MIIAGVDHSTKNVAIAIYNTRLKGFEDVSIHTAKGRLSTDRFAEIFGYFDSYVIQHPFVEYWVVEDIIFGPNPKSTVDQAKIFGALKAVLILKDKKHITPAPTVWKKEVLGKGNASKDEIVDFIELIHPTMKWLSGAKVSQDEYDACALALFGAKIVNGIRS